MKEFEPALHEAARATRGVVFALNIAIGGGHDSDTEVLRRGVESCLALIGQLEGALRRARVFEDRVDGGDDGCVVGGEEDGD